MYACDYLTLAWEVAKFLASSRKVPVICDLHVVTLHIELLFHYGIFLMQKYYAIFSVKNIQIGCVLGEVFLWSVFFARWNTIMNELNEFPFEYIMKCVLCNMHMKRCESYTKNRTECSMMIMRDIGRSSRISVLTHSFDSSACVRPGKTKSRMLRLTVHHHSRYVGRRKCYNKTSDEILFIIWMSI